MGRHRISDGRESTGGAPPARTRRRATAAATALVITAGAGTFAVLRGGLLPLSGACRGGTVRIGAVASPDIAPALTAVADRARREHDTTDGRCLDVRVTARNSADVAAELVDNTKKPDFAVWVPDDSLWVAQTSATGSARALTKLRSVAESPVVVGALQSQAKTLGWPSKTYTWAELAGVAGSRPDLRFGTADPALNSTGMLALAMINASIARAGGSEGTDSDTESAAAAKALAQRTEPSDEQAVATLPRDTTPAELADPKRSQALILSEQAAFAHNGGSAPPLRLFYPSDGAATLDYPYTMVDDLHLSTDQGRAANRFLTLLGNDEGVRTIADAGFRTPGGDPDTETVRRAGGQSPQPLSATPAPSPSAPELQKLRLMWQITVQSARITTVVDVSGSMADVVPGSGGRSRLDITKESLRQALSQFTPKDEIGLWRFSTRLSGSRDYQEIVRTGPLGGTVAKGVTRRQQLDSAFHDLQPVPGGSTGLYDTALAVYRSAVSSYGTGKFNAVVILTDGANEDPGSISLNALTSRLKTLDDPARPVPLIAIAVGANADKAACDRIAKATGGAAYQVNDPSEIQAVLLKAVVAAATSAAAKAP
ncbi:substrate-binding and VWA domain-containing protein [Streptomyces sp. NPDC003300]|uniref:substrate-binding and VWA domain-containing protein n=1 Tax=unclassified Streptomyces TaxID=2593676 RepID=UPI0033A462B6